MTPVSDTLPLSLAMALAIAAAVGSSPAGRRTMAMVHPDMPVAVVNEIGAAMAEGMSPADPAGSSDAMVAPSPAIAPLPPLLRQGAHRTAS